MIQQSVHLRHTRLPIVLFTTLMLLVACTSAPVEQPEVALSLPAEPNPPAAIETARGFWEGVGGDINISEHAVGQMYNYDWYAIEPTTVTRATVVWDNGLNCSRTDGTMTGNRITLTERDVIAEFIIHDKDTATVTFQQGTSTWTKQLKKTRNDPKVVCN